MNRNERFKDPQTALQFSLDAYASEMWSALPCVIQSFNSTLQTCTAQPTTYVRVRNPNGTTQMLQLPILVDVPVVFPRGGGYALTFPIVEGDEALVVFATRCIDSWWESGGVQNIPTDLRMHDLSDGFAIPGPCSKPRALSGFSAGAAQLRNTDGTVVIELSGDEINIVSPGDMLVTTPTLRVTGDVICQFGTPQQYSVSSLLAAYNLHTHGNVTNGPDITNTTSDPV